MPIGEDIPMLIPTALVLVVFLVFVLSLFASYSEQQDITKMSQNSLNIGSYVINSKFNAPLGQIDMNKLGTNFSYCKKLSELNISSTYKILVNISTSDKKWCWDNYYSISDAKISVSNNFPILLINNTTTEFGQVKVSASK